MCVPADIGLFFYTLGIERFQLDKKDRMNLDDIRTTTVLNNGCEMPVLGLGVYKTKNGREVIDSIHYALEAGYRHIDTASYYENEEGVGKAVRSADIAREEIFITTKVWIDDQGYDNTIKAFNTSLKKLNLEYVDLYLIHWPVPKEYSESWKALEKLYKEGRIKAIGLSNSLQHHIEEICNICEIKPMVLQNEFHPRLVQQELLDFCRIKGIQYEAWAPLMRGRILNNEVITGLAEKYYRTPAQILIRWDLQKGVVTIPKSVHKERIIENSKVFDFVLAEEDVQLIDALDREERTGAHPDNFLDHFR